MSACMAHLRDEPALATCNTLCDLSGYTGDVTAGDLAAVATVTNKHWPPASRARTAFVTKDPGFPNWARIMCHQFDEREFKAFESAEAAEMWLAQT
ncbi:MAG TPA: hypothetical protein VGL66_12165 [Caulobacteraceae bacterium]